MQTSKSLSLLCLIESEEFGPVFIQEPDDVIFPLDSDEKKVVMHCEARGNPPPTYRCDTYLSALLIAVLLSQLISSHFSKCTLLLLLVLFFSWYINRTEVDAEADYRYSFIDGNLIITNASEITDYGKYQCKAENSFGTVLSRDALLQFACKYTLYSFIQTPLQTHGLIIYDVFYVSACSSVSLCKKIVHFCLSGSRGVKNTPLTRSK